MKRKKKAVRNSMRVNAMLGILVFVVSAIAYAMASVGGGESGGKVSSDWHERQFTMIVFRS